MKTIDRLKNVFTRGQVVPVPEFPKSIILEPTNACNLRCRMCPIYGEGVNNHREVGFIKKAIWTNLIDELGSWPSRVDLDVHGAGEPLLHPHFLDILSYVKTKENISLGFLCNGTLFDHAKARAVIEIGVDWICFSVDGAEKDIFEYYRKGAVLEAVEDNIRYFLSLRKNEKPHIRLNMVHHEEAALDLFIDKWAGIADSLSISIKRPARREYNSRLKLLKPCPLLYQQLAVGWPGKTGLCCEDIWGDYITGEFPTQSLYEIWHGRYLEEARKLHEVFKPDKLHLCKTCNAQIFHRQEVKIAEKNGVKTYISRELTETNPDLALSVQ